MKAPARRDIFGQIATYVKFVITISLVLSIASSSLLSTAAWAQSDSRPRLVLLVVADQFSYNFLSRYRDKFSTGGLRMLTDRGASYTSCRYNCATTQRDCGNSTIATGAYPWTTGVVADQWYNRGKKAISNAVLDDQAEVVGAMGKAGSNRLVKGTTIGDEMKLATNGRSKVFALGVDQSSSLLLAGRLANNALWLDAKSGNIVSSSKFGRTLPEWVTEFNNQHYPMRYVGKPWQQLMAATEYSASTRDDYPREKDFPRDGKVFPHTISAAPANEGDLYGAFAMSPFANQMILDLAKEAIDKEFLGQHTDTDLLAVSLSAGEQLNQYFGPYSQETEDLILRMDQSLASLFQAVDQKVGLSKCLVVFTASHGSPAIPEFLQERGLDAGRVDPKVFANFLDAKLDTRVGPEDWIEAFHPPNLYFNLDAIDKQKLRQPDVESLVANFTHSVPGIGDVFTAWQLFTNQPPNSPLMEKVRRSYVFGRSGELYITPKPGYVFSSEQTGTGYGSPYDYDTQVPLLLFGVGISQGRFSTAVSPIDIAPTIAAILGIENPSCCEGKPLADAVSSGARRP